ncbi:restriction endonuclease subunit S [Aliarcobacter skirrowii]|uniref:restriction endonuclease subunit S n=1 Tax=Aliarcobacter skirrowii TaxID=28200 RepID=UPI0029B0D73C|nr:restriction endonuclease subunit S [Aliarcobacter skirrowii]MDX4049296.1 restriction endonuclease subunit S [Aliarcobacter skirrowii]
MSNLPIDWKFDTFENLGIQIIDGDRGNNYPKQNEFMQEGYCLFLSAKNVTKRGFEFIEKQFISEEKDSLLRKGKLSKGDLVLTTRGTVGNVAFFNDSIKYDNIRINSGMVLLRVSDNVDNLFLYKIMTSDFIQQYIQNIAFGSAQPQLTVKEIKKFQIPLPPLEEQKKIADILSTVDKKIAFVEENINATEELKKGLMQKLLTEGIGHTEFKDSELGRIPESWEIECINELTLEHKQGYYTKDNYVEEGIYLIRITDMNNPKISYIDMPKLQISDNDYELFKVSKGDFLFARSGAIGRYGIVYEDIKAVFGSYIIRFVFNQNKLMNEFFGYFYESDKCLKQLNSITQGSSNININANNIKSLKLALPQLEEQKQIVEILSTVDKKLENLKEKKESFEELKKGLMQKLLTGEVRV